MDIREIIRTSNYCIVDVREPYEFASGHAPGAKNIPLSRFMEGLPEIEKCDGHVLFYCRSGMRSGQAEAFLRSRGHNNVWNAGSLWEMETYLRDA